MIPRNRIIRGKKHKLYFYKTKRGIYPFIARIVDEQGEIKKRIGYEKMLGVKEIRQILINYEKEIGIESKASNK